MAALPCRQLLALSCQQESKTVLLPETKVGKPSIIDNGGIIDNGAPSEKPTSFVQKATWVNEALDPNLIIGHNVRTGPRRHLEEVKAAGKEYYIA